MKGSLVNFPDYAHFWRRLIFRACVVTKQCMIPNRLAWRQKKYAIAGTEYDKVIDLTKRRFGDDAIELIDVYQESGRVSFVQYCC